jgi:hypothetical protein
MSMTLYFKKTRRLYTVATQPTEKLRHQVLGSRSNLFHGNARLYCHIPLFSSVDDLWQRQQFVSFSLCTFLGFKSTTNKEVLLGQVFICLGIPQRPNAFWQARSTKWQFVRKWECMSQNGDTFTVFAFLTGDSSLGDCPCAPMAWAVLILEPRTKTMQFKKQ